MSVVNTADQSLLGVSVQSCSILIIGMCVDTYNLIISYLILFMPQLNIHTPSNSILLCIYAELDQYILGKDVLIFHLSKHLYNNNLNTTDGESAL